MNMQPGVYVSEVHAPNFGIVAPDPSWTYSCLDEFMGLLAGTADCEKSLI